MSNTPLESAIDLLGVYTAGRFDLWLLSGRAKASCRAHVLSTLENRNVPQSKAGVNALRDAFYSAIGVTGDCPAEREENFRNYCRTA